MEEAKSKPSRTIIERYTDTVARSQKSQARVENMKNQVLEAARVIQGVPEQAPTIVQDPAMPQPEAMAVPNVPSEQELKDAEARANGFNNEGDKIGGDGVPTKEEPAAQVEQPQEPPPPQLVPTTPKNPGNARFAGMDAGFVGGTMGVHTVDGNQMMNPRFKR